MYVVGGGGGGGSCEWTFGAHVRVCACKKHRAITFSSFLSSSSGSLEYTDTHELLFATLTLYWLAVCVCVGILIHDAETIGLSLSPSLCSSTEPTLDGLFRSRRFGRRDIRFVAHSQWTSAREVFLSPFDRKNMGRFFFFNNWATQPLKPKIAPR